MERRSGRDGGPIRLRGEAVSGTGHELKRGSTLVAHAIDHHTSRKFDTKLVRTGSAETVSGFSSSGTGSFGR